MSVYFDDQPEHQTSPADSAPAQAGQSPLLLHDMSSPEEMFAMPRASQRPRQAVVAVLLVAGAVGAIFAMRHFGMGPAVSLAGVDVDYKPAGSASGLSPKQVLADLERSRMAVQVPADHITQDPFELANLRPAADAPTIDPDLAGRNQAEKLRLAAEARRKLLDTEFGKLKLQGVMGGSAPVARVGGRLYKVGMTVAEHFTVTAIEGREVTLTADDRTFVLTMTDK
jgi:hypothetical protein